MARYVHATVIHVVLDNFRIHDSKIVHKALAGYAGRIRLHFLPPYCPEENKIERVWQDLHANVTRNHCRPNMVQLMEDVRDYITRRNRRIAARVRRQVA